MGGGHGASPSVEDPGGRASCRSSAGSLGRVFTWRERLEPEGYRYGVEWGITDRHGGVGSPPFAELNLANHVGDVPEVVATNRHRLAHAWGAPAPTLRFMDQQHGAVVAQIHQEDERPPSADAMVTTNTDLTLVVMVADCVPIVLVDREAGVIAAVHAGRPGMMARIVPRAVARMVDLGATAPEAIVGPSVCPRCYEVPEEMRAQAAAITPAAYGVSRTGTAAVDVAAAVVAQLREADVAVRWLPGCTRENPGLFSYRRDGRTGRFAGLVRLLAPQGAA